MRQPKRIMRGPVEVGQMSWDPVRYRKVEGVEAIVVVIHGKPRTFTMPRDAERWIEQNGCTIGKAVESPGQASEAPRVVVAPPPTSTPSVAKTQKPFAKPLKRRKPDAA